MPPQGLYPLTLATWMLLWAPQMLTSPSRVPDLLGCQDGRGDRANWNFSPGAGWAWARRRVREQTQGWNFHRTS